MKALQDITTKPPVPRRMNPALAICWYGRCARCRQRNVKVRALAGQAICGECFDDLGGDDYLDALDEVDKIAPGA